MKKITVYGSGCKTCVNTKDLIRRTAEELGVEVDIEKIPLDDEEAPEAFYVPVEAVFSAPGSERFVWVQDPKTARVSKRRVTVGSMAGGNIQVLTGLKVGDTIAVSGVHHLREGMKVRPLVFHSRRAAE